MAANCSSVICACPASGWNKSRKAKKPKNSNPALVKCANSCFIHISVCRVLCGFHSHLRFLRVTGHVDRRQNAIFPLIQLLARSKFNHPTVGVKNNKNHIQPRKAMYQSHIGLLFRLFFRQWKLFLCCKPSSLNINETKNLISLY